MKYFRIWDEDKFRCRSCTFVIVSNECQIGYLKQYIYDNQFFFFNSGIRIALWDENFMNKSGVTLKVIILSVAVDIEDWIWNSVFQIHDKFNYVMDNCWYRFLGERKEPEASETVYFFNQKIFFLFFLVQ